MKRVVKYIPITMGFIATMAILVACAPPVLVPHPQPHIVVVPVHPPIGPL